MLIGLESSRRQAFAMTHSVVAAAQVKQLQSAGFVQKGSGWE